MFRRRKRRREEEDREARYTPQDVPLEQHCGVASQYVCDLMRTAQAPRRCFVRPLSTAHCCTADWM